MHVQALQASSGAHSECWTEGPTSSWTPSSHLTVKLTELTTSHHIQQLPCLVTRALCSALCKLTPKSCRSWPTHQVSESHDWTNSDAGHCTVPQTCLTNYAKPDEACATVQNKSNPPNLHPLGREASSKQATNTRPMLHSRCRQEASATCAM